MVVNAHISCRSGLRFVECRGFDNHPDDTKKRDDQAAQWREEKQWHFVLPLKNIYVRDVSKEDINHNVGDSPGILDA